MGMRRLSQTSSSTGVKSGHASSSRSDHDPVKLLWRLQVVEYVSADDVIVNLADLAWCKGTELARDATGGMKYGVKLFALTGRTPKVGASCFINVMVNKGKESHGCFLMS